MPKNPSVPSINTFSIGRSLVYVERGAEGECVFLNPKNQRRATYVWNGKKFTEKGEPSCEEDGSSDTSQVTS